MSKAARLTAPLRLQSRSNPALHHPGISSGGNQRPAFLFLSYCPVRAGF